MPTDIAPSTAASSRVDTKEMKAPDKLVKLPSINPTASKLLGLAADYDTGLKKFVAVIEEDPAFGAEVLRMANSPLFGLTSNVHALSHAIALMGLERIKALALTAAAKTYVGNGASPALRNGWTHSLACALLCRELAPFFKLDDSRAYALGLMHDIGRLGLIKSYPEEYSGVLSQQYSRSDEIIKLEQSVLGMDHCKAGFWLTRTWGFPAAFSKICTQHHDPLNEQEHDFLELIQVSCALATAVGFSAIRCNPVDTFEKLLMGVPGISVHDAKWSSDQVRERIANKVAAAER